MLSVHNVINHDIGSPIRLSNLLLNITRVTKTSAHTMSVMFSEL